MREVRFRKASRRSSSPRLLDLGAMTQRRSSVRKTLFGLLEIESLNFFRPSFGPAVNIPPYFSPVVILNPLIIVFSNTSFRTDVSSLDFSPVLSPCLFIVYAWRQHLCPIFFFSSSLIISRPCLLFNNPHTPRPFFAKLGILLNCC